ncbi:HisA/HisF-related TIM barrel protein [Pajaroellobacter abortibovis]|uniref:HisA/HisF-related TIM barrel protein n=1 Tax=Pajaroellobacter abortibovis TaxID=1882918 RepID=UPI0023DD950D|nr:HisA/HisF-related TIM barrel protein [Pajaroellobacter abortibovis]
MTLNCMNVDSVRQGDDIGWLQLLREWIGVPLIASGVTGTKEDFREVLMLAHVSGALATSVFPQRLLYIN